MRCTPKPIGTFLLFSILTVYDGHFITTIHTTPVGWRCWLVLAYRETINSAINNLTPLSRLLYKLC
jgi:hypothetical protein